MSLIALQLSPGQRKSQSIGVRLWDELGIFEELEKMSEARVRRAGEREGEVRVPLSDAFDQETIQTHERNIESVLPSNSLTHFLKETKEIALEKTPLSKTEKL